MSFTNTPSSTLTNDATNLANNAAGGQALSPVSGDPLIGANPTVNTIDTAAPIGGTAQAGAKVVRLIHKQCKFKCAWRLGQES